MAYDAAYQRAYYLRNRDKILKQQREYRQRTSAEARKIYQAAYYADNHERVRAQQNSYRLQNIEKLREQAARYRRTEEGRARKRLNGQVPANAQRNLERSQFWRHGIRPEDWAAMYDAQDGKCYLCRRDLADLKAAIDHDHSHCGRRRSCSVCRRGMACNECNIAIGHAGDDPARLRRIADALEMAQAAVRSRMEAQAMQEQLILPV